MTDRAGGAVEPTQNLARPVARAAGIVAYVADVLILLTLIVQLVLGQVSGARALVVGLLAIAVFALAAGLAYYAGGVGSFLLVGFAGAYALISAAVLILAAFDPEPGNGGALQVGLVLFVALAVAVMAVITGSIAGLPARRLAIPFIVVALLLTIVATLMIVFDGSMSMGDSRSVTLARLLASLVTTGAIVAWFLASPPDRSGPSRREARLSR